MILTTILMVYALVYVKTCTAAEFPQMIDVIDQGYSNNYDGVMEAFLNDPKRHFVSGLYQSEWNDDKNDRKYWWKYTRVSDIHTARTDAENKVELEITDYDGYFERYCPADTGMYKVYSTHSNQKEDRQWTFTCRRIRDGYYFRNCTLSDWKGIYSSGGGAVWSHGNPAYSCPDSGALRGVISEHKNAYTCGGWSCDIEDRRFKYACCRIAEGQVFDNICDDYAQAVANTGVLDSCVFDAEGTTEATTVVNGMLLGLNLLSNTARMAGVPGMGIVSGIVGLAQTGSALGSLISGSASPDPYISLMNTQYTCLLTYIDSAIQNMEAQTVTFRNNVLGSALKQSFEDMVTEFGFIVDNNNNAADKAACFAGEEAAGCDSFFAEMDNMRNEFNQIIEATKDDFCRVALPFITLTMNFRIMAYSEYFAWIIEKDLLTEVNANTYANEDYVSGSRRDTWADDNIWLMNTYTMCLPVAYEQIMNDATLDMLERTNEFYSAIGKGDLCTWAYTTRLMAMNNDEWGPNTGDDSEWNAYLSQAVSEINNYQYQIDNDGECGTFSWGTMNQFDSDIGTVFNTFCDPNNPYNVGNTYAVIEHCEDYWTECDDFMSLLSFSCGSGYKTNSAQWEVGCWKIKCGCKAPYSISTSETPTSNHIFDIIVSVTMICTIMLLSISIKMFYNFRYVKCEEVDTYTVEEEEEAFM